MPDEPVSNPDSWRDRARIARIKADGARDPRSKRMLRGIAEAYEGLAQKLEQRLRDEKKIKKRTHAPPNRYRGLPMTVNRVAATNEDSSSMSDSSEFKIRRWERYIDESRRELKLLSPEGQVAMQRVIDSYESLIAMERGKDKRG
jgi:hypothetical protein